MKKVLIKTLFSILVFFQIPNAYSHNDINLDGVFDILKLRVGYGEVGNVNGLGDYNFLTRYVKSNKKP